MINEKIPSQQVHWKKNLHDFSTALEVQTIVNSWGEKAI